MTALRIRGGVPLRGKLRVCSDLELGQEALLWASLATGPSVLRGLSMRPDHRAWIAVLAALGVEVREAADGVLHVRGVGWRGFSPPKGALFAGSSSSTLELTTALLCGQPFGTRVEAEGPLAARSVRNVVEPLRARGAVVSGVVREDELRPPISVAPLFADERLSEIEIEIPAGDAATKRALLISGLYAQGVTAISEGVLSRDHTERALMALGLDVQTLGPLCVLDTSARAPSFAGFDWTLPGDFTVAALLSALISVLPGSAVTIEGVGVNPTRASFLTALQHLGADFTVTPKGDLAGNEPIADLFVRAGALRGASFGGELAQRALSEAPALLLLGARAKGKTKARDLAGLRTHKPDLLSGAVALARRFGVEATAYEDGFDVEPVAQLHAAEVPAGDTRLALLGLVLALCAPGESHLEDAEGLSALYPGLIPSLRGLGAEIAV